MRSRLLSAVAACAAVSVIAAGAATIEALRAQELDIELYSTAHLLPDVGAGFRAIHRDSTGRFYVLAAPGTFLSIYTPEGKPAGKVPSSPSKSAALVEAADFDVDSSGRVVVADRGANEIKIFDTAGQMRASFAATSPASVAALPSGEIAVTSAHSKKLVDVYDRDGKWLRTFGDRTSLADHAELNRSLNLGKLLEDPEDHLYYAFSYLPEPTVRRYDLSGRTSLEISLGTIEFAPVAEATRHQISEQDEKPGPGSFKPVVNAVGVDPQTLDIWVAIDDELTHFDRNGARRGETYRTFTSDGDRVVPISLLVEPNRLILAGDPIGVYAFPRPDKAPGIAPEKSEEKSPAAEKHP